MSRPEKSGTEPVPPTLNTQVLSASKEGPEGAGEAAPPTLASSSPAQVSALPPRITVAGYEIVSELGHGGMGVVYEARQQGLNRLVALKMILRAEHASADDRERFQREAQAVAQLQHPNIVQVYEVGEHDGLPYFSLELCTGGSLDGMLRGVPLPPRQAAELIETLARAMDYAHQKGIVHRDLKPANVLLAARGLAEADAKPQAAVLKITDFGLAKHVGNASGQTRTGAVVGTPSYMAPEQALGRSREAGPAADIYALGAILYECLTGRPPFRADSAIDTLTQVVNDDPVPPARLQSKVPRDLETVCLKCLDKEPARRYATAGDLAEDLHRFQAGEPIEARPASAIERGAKWARRRPAVAGLLALLVFVTAVGFTLVTWKWRAAAAHAKAEAEARADAEKQTGEALKQTKIAREAADVAANFSNALFGRLLDDASLRAPGMEPFRKLFLQLGADFYKAFLPYKNTGADSDAERAGLLVRQARITDEIGSQAEALTIFQEALQLYQTLEKRHPAEAVYQREQGNVLYYIAYLRSRMSDKGQAAELYQQLLALREKLAKAGPQDASRESDLAHTLNDIGVMHHSQNKPDEAAKAWTRALEVRQRLAKAHPKVGAYQNDLASSLNNLGVLARDRKEKGRALELWTQARAIRAQLAEDYPDELAYQRELAMMQLNLGALHVDSRQLDKADELYSRCREVLVRLTDRQPVVTSYQEDLASVCHNLGHVARQLNQTERAKEALIREREILERLARQQPGIVSYAIGAARAQVRLADLARGSDSKAAVEGFTRAVSRLDELRKQPGVNGKARRTLAEALGGRGETLSLLGQHEEALKDWDRTLELEKASDPLPYRAGRAVALARKGDWKAGVAAVEALLSGGNASGEVFIEVARIYALAAVAQSDLTGVHADIAEQLLVKLDQSGFFKVPLQRQAALDEAAFQKLPAFVELKKGW